MLNRYRGIIAGLFYFVVSMSALVAIVAHNGTTVTKTVTTPAPALLTPAPTACPVGSSFMGCSASTSTGIFAPRLSLTTPPGGRFPDVSNYQGEPNWTAAKPSIVGAAAKLGEGDSVFDSSAAYNVAAFKRLGIHFIVYWFVRPDGCTAEANEIKWAVQRVGGVPLVVLDEEVPGIDGYAACLNPAVVSATGKNAVVYRSSGNDYDASNPKGVTLACWVAAYGPAAPPLCSGRTRVAWQLTDGRYGYPLYIPGVGQGDVSVDEGIFKLAYPATQPKPSHHYSWAPNTRRTLHVTVNGRTRTIHAREQLAMRTWDRGKCRTPVKRRICATARNHLLLLAGRISFIARHTGKHLKHLVKHPRWGAVHYRAGKHKTTLGGMYQQLIRRTAKKNHGVVAAW